MGSVLPLKAKARSLWVCFRTEKPRAPKRLEPSSDPHVDESSLGGPGDGQLVQALAAVHHQRPPHASGVTVSATRPNLQEVGQPKTKYSFFPVAGFFQSACSIIHTSSGVPSSSCLGPLKFHAELNPKPAHWGLPEGFPKPT